jgi:hypothetical protein
MSSFLDYIAWRGDLSFDTAPFNNVDNVIFATVTYYPFDGIVPGIDDSGSVSLKDAASAVLAAAKKNPHILDMEFIFGGDERKLLESLVDSRRFNTLRLQGFTNHFDIEAEKQFSSLTILPEKNSAIRGRNPLPYVAFRGTDSSILGWKEDLNMALDEAIPSQLDAKIYLEKIAKKLKGNFNVGGHSKGGNLAVYASSFCDEKTSDRIATVYNNDGPGFHKSVVQSKGYRAIEKKLITIIPKSSIIGLMFEQGAKYQVVEATAGGLFQHNPFTWQTQRSGFIRVNNTDGGSRYVNKTLMEWLSTMDREHRITFIESVYDVLDQTGAKTIPDITNDWFKNAKIIIKALNQYDKKTRAMLASILKSLVSVSTQTLTLELKKKIRRK